MSCCRIADGWPVFLRKKNVRGERRLPANEEATITVLAGEPLTVSGILIDMSESGAGVLVKDFVMRGLPVEVRWSRGSVRGQVQYCRAEAGGYKVGVRSAAV